MTSAGGEQRRPERAGWPVRRRRAGASFAAGICLARAALATQPAMADCKTTPWNLGASLTGVTTTWTLAINQPCKQRVGTGSRRHGYLDNLRISQQAAHGLAGVSNSIADHGLAYKPNANFAGRDHFQVTVDHHYSWQTTSDPATIDVDIQVVEGK
jgi:hypothetical protein